MDSPPFVEDAAAAALRGPLFGDLDRLAFALEMNAAEMIGRGDAYESRLRAELLSSSRPAPRDPLVLLRMMRTCLGLVYVLAAVLLLLAYLRDSDAACGPA